MCILSFGNQVLLLSCQMFLSQILFELFPLYHILILLFRYQMDNKMRTRKFELYSYRRRKI